MVCPSIVVVGASAGGLQAVTKLLHSLPAEFPASVFIVVHRGPEGPAMLPGLLQSASRLPVRVPYQPEDIRPGTVYLPPLDCHLLIRDSVVHSVHGPRQHGFRPAVDPLFISAAEAHRESVAGVILSGALDDGTAGLLAIKRNGGVAIVQNPDEALVDSMPLSALKNVEVDAVLPASEIGPRLMELVNARNRTMPNKSGVQEKALKRTLTPFTCPSCGGALWEVEEKEGVDQYECHVGHRFGSEALKVLEDERTENLLWAAARALQEDSALRRRMAARASARGLGTIAERWLDDADKSYERAQSVRQLIEQMSGDGEGEEPALEVKRRKPQPRRAAAPSKTNATKQRRTHG